MSTWRPFIGGLLIGVLITLSIFALAARADGPLIDRETYGTALIPAVVLKDQIRTHLAAEQLAKPDPVTYPALPGEKHFCPICISLKWKSKVYSKAACTVTATAGCTQPYWDENGNRQAPIPCNVKACGYTCSQGHAWTEAENIP